MQIHSPALASSLSTQTLEEVCPPFSAVVLFWRGSESIEECLLALRRAGETVGAPLEILVLNNGAKEERFNECRHLADHWIVLPENIGPSAARNLGAKLARGQFIAFIDDDGLVNEHFFAAALPYFEDPDMLGIRGRLLPRNHPYFSSLASHYDRGDLPIDDALITEGATIVRRVEFLECGGYPEGVYGHEGIELTYRLKRSRPRGRTLYVPEMILYHDYLESWGEFLEKMTRFSINEEVAKIREPEAARFLESYFARSFPSPALSKRHRGARAGLRVLRSLLQISARQLHKFRKSSL